MMEINSTASGPCQTCEVRHAVYSITTAPEDYWAGPTQLCQPCLFGVAQKNARLNFVLLLQAATRMTTTA